MLYVTTSASDRSRAWASLSPCLQLSLAPHLAILCGHLFPPSLRADGGSDRARSCCKPRHRAGGVDKVGTHRDPLYHMLGVSTANGLLVLRVAVAGKCLRAHPLLPGVACSQWLSGTGVQRPGLLVSGGTTPWSYSHPAAPVGSGCGWTPAEPTLLPALLPSLP